MLSKEQKKNRRTQHKHQIANQLFVRSSSAWLSLASKIILFSVSNDVDFTSIVLHSLFLSGTHTHTHTHTHEHESHVQHTVG
jgi:hypothetical protein